MADFLSQELLLTKQLKNLTLLLIGRTGNGKSSTGNSILGEKRFNTKASSSASTLNCQVETTSIEAPDCTVTVVDTPDMFKSSESRMEVEAYFRKGFHAILIILTIKRRSSRKEISEYQSLQTAFGKAITGYMIVIFTGGDILEDNETLHDYIGQECPRFVQDFLRLCNNRVVLFNNKAKDEQKKVEQVYELFHFVEEVLQANNGNPFTSALFEVLNHENEAKAQNPSKQLQQHPKMEFPEVPTLGVEDQRNMKPSASGESLSEEARTGRQIMHMDVAQTASEAKASGDSNLLFVPEELYKNMIEPYSWTLLGGLVHGKSPDLSREWSIFSKREKWIQSHKEIYTSLRETWSNIRIKNETFLTGRNGLFLIKLDNEVDMQYILTRPTSTWKVRGYNLIVRQWKPGIGRLLDTVSGNRVWVRLPDLPLELWRKEVYTMIASCLKANLLEVDDRRIILHKLQFPRICLQFLGEYDPINKVQIAIENRRIFEQVIQYEAVTWPEVIVDHDRPDGSKAMNSWNTNGRHYLVIEEALYDEMMKPFRWTLLAGLSSVDHKTRAEWDKFNTENKTMTNDQFIYERLKALLLRFIANFDLLIGRNDSFILKFHNKVDMYCILELKLTGFLKLGGRTLMILKMWEPGIEWSLNNTRKFVWLRLPDLSVELWTLDVFRGIASHINSHLVEVDSRTRDLQRLEFARIRVEILNSFEHIDEVEIEIQDCYVFMQKILYEKIMEDEIKGVHYVDTTGSPTALQTKTVGHSHRLFVPKGRYEEMARPFSYVLLAGIAPPEKFTKGERQQKQKVMEYDFIYGMLRHNWRNIVNLQFSTARCGLFLVRVNSEKEIEYITKQGPWELDGYTLNFKRWKPGFSWCLHPNNTKSVWLRLPDLSVELWDAHVFNGIASLLNAKLVAVDPDTDHKTHLHFARMCIDVPMKFEPIKEVEIFVEGSRVFKQVIVYESLMAVCNECCGCYLVDHKRGSQREQINV